MVKIIVTRPKQGFGLIEVVLASAIISTLLLGMTWVARISFRTVSEGSLRSRADFLLEEGVEVVRILRDTSWSSYIATLATNTVYYPVFSGLSWNLSTSSPGLIDGLFERQIIFGDVYRRNSDDDIIDISAPDPKTKDAGTRLVSARVLWRDAIGQIGVSFENGTTDGNLASFPSNNAGDGDPAQSFTTPSSGNPSVSKADLFIRRATSDPSDISLEIRSASPVGTVLATSQPVDSAALSSTLSWNTFTFAAPPVLAPNTEYFLRLRSIPESTVAFSGSQGYVHWGYQQTGPSPYVGGKAWRYVGRLSNPNDQGQVLDQYDFSFRIYQQISGGTPQQFELNTYMANIFQN